MRGVLKIVGCIIGAFIAYKSYRYACMAVPQFVSVSSCIVEADVRFSAEAKKSLATTIQTDSLVHCMPQERAALLNDACPYSTRQRVALNGKGECVVWVEGQDPWCVVNDDMVLTHQETVVKKELFDDYFLALVPRVTMQLGEAACIDKQCIDFLRHLNWHIINDYVVAWHSPIKVVMRHKKYTNFYLLCSNEQTPTPEIISLCEHILHDATIQKDLQKNPSKQWCADMRFKGQVVVYAQKKGGGHGSDIF